VAIVLLTAAIFAAGVPPYLGALHEACRVGPCAGGQLSPADMRALHDLGLSIELYAAYVLALDLLIALGFCAVGIFVFWRRSLERGPLLVSFALVIFGLTWPGVFDASLRHPVWGGVAGFLAEFGLASLVVLFLTFPDGRFVPRWTRWVAVFAVAQPVLHARFPASPLVELPQLLNILAFLGLWAVCLFAQVYRYRRVSGPVQRQQIKWLVFGIGALVVSLLGYFLLPVALPQLDRAGVPSLSYDLLGRTVVGSLGFLLIPVSVGIAIVRHSLWDIDVVINRTLVYGSLTTILALVYLGGVVGLERTFRALTGQGSTLAVVTSTLAIAALFNPLRRRIQGFIDRRFYRRKYDAAKTLEAFSTKLRHETALDDLSDDLKGVVRETMQPAHVSLWLRPGPGPTGSRGSEQPRS